MTETQAIKRRILVVDDEPRVLRFIEIGLRNRGFEVMTTGSGEAALALIEQAEPDVILLDIVMPGLDGLEVLRRVRATRKLPVITFSANLENRHKALSLGANNFVSKPFDSDKMALMIRDLLNN